MFQLNQHQAELHRFKPTSRNNTAHQSAPPPPPMMLNLPIVNFPKIISPLFL